MRAVSSNKVEGRGKVITGQWVVLSLRHGETLDIVAPDRSLFFEGC